MLSNIIPEPADAGLRGRTGDHDSNSTGALSQPQLQPGGASVDSPEALLAAAQAPA
jgi:hypothetical protein